MVFMCKLILSTYVANSPSNGALITGGRGLVCLALDAQIHDVVATDGTVVHHNVCNNSRN